MGKAETLATIWEIPDHLWEQIHPVILELDRPKATGANALPPDGCWTASFSGCAAAASGTACRRNWGMTAPSTGPSSAGYSWACWRESGPSPG